MLPQRQQSELAISYEVRETTVSGQKTLNACLSGRTLGPIPWPNPLVRALLPEPFGHKVGAQCPWREDFHEKSFSQNLSRKNWHDLSRNNWHAITGYRPVNRGWGRGCSFDRQAFNTPSGGQSIRSPVSSGRPYLHQISADVLPRRVPIFELQSLLMKSSRRPVPPALLVPGGIPETQPG